MFSMSNDISGQMHEYSSSIHLTKCFVTSKPSPFSTIKPKNASLCLSSFSFLFSVSKWIILSVATTKASALCDQLCVCVCLCVSIAAFWNMQSACWYIKLTVVFYFIVDWAAVYSLSHPSWHFHCNSSSCDSVSIICFIVCVHAFVFCAALKQQWKRNCAPTRQIQNKRTYIRVSARACVCAEVLAHQTNGWGKF